MLYIMIGIVGFLIGFLCTSIIKHFVQRKPIGTIRMDQSDPDSGPYLFLELNPGGANELYKKKYVYLKVNLKSYIPQK